MICYKYLFVYLTLPGTHPLFMVRKASSKSEINICSNKNETGLVKYYMNLQLISKLDALAKL